MPDIDPSESTHTRPDAEPAAVHLMNTLRADRADRAGLRDDLATVPDLADWAGRCGLADPTTTRSLTDADLAQARALRGSLRRLAARVVGDDRAHAVDADLSPERASSVLNGFLAHATVSLELKDSRPAAVAWHSARAGFLGELDRLAVEAADLLANHADRLGACHGPGCVLYFDRGQGRREWCSAACGNRARVARHYRKQRAAGG